MLKNLTPAYPLLYGTTEKAGVCSGTRAPSAGRAYVGPLHTCFPFLYKEFRMKVLSRMWKEEDGVLSFEWVLLVTLLTIGIVGGLAAARDAIIDELGDVSEAMLALDQSYRIEFPLSVLVHVGPPSSASDSTFTDARNFVDCGRTVSPIGQAAGVDAANAINEEATQ
jgi:Flp pilus assembly pilin Flp